MIGLFLSVIVSLIFVIVILSFVIRGLDAEIMDLRNRIKELEDL